MKRIHLAALGALLSFSAWLSFAAWADSAYVPPSQVVFPRLASHWYIYSDFETSVTTTGAGDFLSAVSGTGAAIAFAVPWATNVYGAVQLQLGTVATNSVSLRTAVTALKLGGGVMKGRTRVLTSQVSNPTDTYTFRWGMIDSGTAESANAVMFRTTAATPFEWHVVTRAASVETVTDTNVAVQAGFDYRLSYEINAAGSQVLFYINNILVGTHTANIPTLNLGFGAMALRSAGTAVLSPISIDYMEAEAIPTTQR